MSAPHPKVKDDAGPLSWFGRKPAAETNGHSSGMPASDSIALDFDMLAKEIAINRIAEIAKLMRGLTWREMTDLSEAWNTPADVLHKWSKEQSCG